MSRRTRRDILRILYNDDYISPISYEPRRPKKIKSQYRYTNATEREIQMCLNCDKPTCNGYCEHFKEEKDDTKNTRR